MRIAAEKLKESLVDAGLVEAAAFDEARREASQRPEADGDARYETDGCVRGGELGNEKRQQKTRQKHRLCRCGRGLGCNAEDDIQCHASPIGGVMADLSPGHQELAVASVGRDVHGWSIRASIADARRRQLLGL